MIRAQDRLPVWQIVKSADYPRHLMVPLLRKLGLSIEVDQDGEVFTSKTEFRELLIEVAEDQQ